VDHSWK